MQTQEDAFTGGVVLGIALGTFSGAVTVLAWQRWWSQAWFWTPEWLAGEREASADIAAGRTTYYDSDEELEAALVGAPPTAANGRLLRAQSRLPTFDVTDRFWSDWSRLRPDQRAAFLAARADFVGAVGHSSSDLARRGPAAPGWWGSGGETGADNLPTSQAVIYGEEVVAGEPHIVWRRIGTYAIFLSPR